MQTEGISGAQLTGFDLESKFIELGRDLFCDKDWCKATFFAADLMEEPQSARLGELTGTFDVIQASQFLHIFDWDDMSEAVKRMVALSHAQSGSMIVGHNLGSRNPGSFTMPPLYRGKTSHYRHNQQTMRQLFDQVGIETGTEWSLDFGEIPSRAIEQNKNADWVKNDPNMCMVYFAATRL